MSALFIKISGIIIINILCLRSLRSYVKFLRIPTVVELYQGLLLNPGTGRDQDIFCFDRRSVKDMWTDYAKSHIRDYPDSISPQPNRFVNIISVLSQIIFVLHSLFPRNFVRNRLKSNEVSQIE